MSSIYTCEKCGEDYNVKTIHFCANKKQPGHYIIDAESFDKLVEDLDKEPSKAVKKAREKFSQLKKEGE